MPSKWRRINRATSFIGSTFERMTLGAPLLQHLRHDIDLFALENVSQLLTVKPRSGSTLGGVLADERREVGELGQIEFVRVFEQRPAHAFELRVDLLLLPAHRVESLGRVSNDVKLVEGQPRIGQ